MLARERKELEAEEARNGQDHSKTFIPKALRKKLKGVKDPEEKQRIIDEYESTKQSAPSKTGNGYVSATPAEDKSTLWHKDEKFDLNDLSLNLMADDDNLMKKKRHLKWDQTKKRYVEHEVGFGGKAVRVKNEAGKVIDEKKKKPDLYKSWVKRSHLSIQKAGEIEDKNATSRVKSSARDRRELKSKMKSDPRAKQELKQTEQIAKMKKRKQKEADRRKGKRGGKPAHVLQKQNAKIRSRMTPMKSKTILVGKKRRR